MSNADRDLYAARGVSADKADVHRAIRNLDAGLVPDAFAKVLPDPSSNDPNNLLALHADTAGTKASLAYLYWRETGDPRAWHWIVQDALVMNLDDLLCIGATGPFVLSSTIGRNRRHITAEAVEGLIDGTTRLVDALAPHGIVLHHAGGETADVGDIVRTLDVGFTVLTHIHRDRVLPVRPQPGSVVVGLASFGQTTYEDLHNSGIGSNGLTAARHELFHADYRTKYPETYDPGLDPKLVYRGPYSMTDQPEGAELLMGQLALSPTRTYLPVLKPFLEQHRSAVHGIVHNTGGGHTKVRRFAKGLTVVKDKLFTPPFLFREIQRLSGASAQAMYQTFNMGTRLEVYTTPEAAQALLRLAESFNLPAQLIGHVEEGPEGGRVEVRLPEETLVYEG